MDPKKPTDPVHEDLDAERDAGDTASIGVGEGSALSIDGADGQAAILATTELGSSRYVHAAFLAAAVLIGYITSRFVVLIWNRLAEWPLALSYVPQLVRYDEEIRSDIGLVFGALVGILVAVRMYSKPRIRVWSSEVASELSKVTWPDREQVTRGTVIVIVASIVATVYVTILDRLWGFTTGLIYAP